MTTSLKTEEQKKQIDQILQLQKAKEDEKKQKQKDSLKKLKSKHQKEKEEQIKFNGVTLEELKKILVDYRNVVLEKGQTEKMPIDEKTSIVVKIFTDIKLKQSNKILCSIVSNDEELGGLGIYLKEYKQDEQEFCVFVENNSSSRQFSINYVIIE